MSATVLPLPRRMPPVRHLATALGALIVGAVLLVAIVAPLRRRRTIRSRRT